MRQISSDSSKKIRSFKGHMLDYLTYKPNFPSSHILRSLYENERIEAVENYEMLFDDLIIDKTINLRGRCADENLFNRQKPRFYIMTQNLDIWSAIICIIALLKYYISLILRSTNPKITYIGVNSKKLSYSENIMSQ